MPKCYDIIIFCESWNCRGFFFCVLIVQGEMSLDKKKLIQLIPAALPLLTQPLVCRLFIHCLNYFWKRAWKHNWVSSQVNLTVMSLHAVRETQISINKRKFINYSRKKYMSCSNSAIKLYCWCLDVNKTCLMPR